MQIYKFHYFCPAEGFYLTYFNIEFPRTSQQIHIS